MRLKLVIVASLVFLSIGSAALAVPTARTDADFEGEVHTGPVAEDGGDGCPPGVFITDPTPFVDSGDTCGFTNTVSSYSGVCTLPFSYAGEDTIYEVQLGAGNNVSFSADLTGSTGDLALFLIGTCGDGTTCVANSQDAIGPGTGPEDIAAASYTPGTYFLYVDSYYDAGTAGSCGIYTLTVGGTLPVELIEFGIE